MSFGNLKKWELITLGAAAVIAVTMRILEENGVLSLPHNIVLTVLMVFVGVFFLRRPMMYAFEYFKTKTVNKDKLSTAVIDIVFALIAEGVLLYLLLNFG